MALLLGQLLYTSFAQVGFQTLTSEKVPPEVRQAFIEQIVYQYWDAYNPPPADYRAVYLHQIAADQVLFGWLYNDGADDLGRSHVPYFICYYFAGSLDVAQIDAIFAWLSAGVLEIVDRQYLPDSIQNITISKHYSAIRPGVTIPDQIREQCYSKGDQLKLFISNQPILEELDSPEILMSLNGGMHSSQEGMFQAFRSLLHPAPRFEIGANRTKSTEGTNSQLESVLQSFSKDFARLAPTSSRGAGQIRSKLLNTRFQLILAGTIVLCSIGFYTFKIPPTSPPIHSSLSTTKPLTGHSDAVWSAILNPDSKTLISGSADRTFKIWNIQTGTVLQTLSGHTDVVRTLALHEKMLVSGSGDRTIKVWDLQIRQLIQTLEQESPVWSVALSQDGQTLVSGEENGILKIWHLPTGKLLHRVQAHADRIFSVSLSPDGKTLATAGLDQTIKIWQPETGQLLRTITGHSAAVRSLSFSPDGKSLASSSWDTTLKLWDWQTGELLRTFTGHTARVVTVAFSPDGQTLVSGSIDRTVRIWSIQTGQSLQVLSGHQDWVLAIALDPNLLVSSSKDQTLRIWQIKSPL